MIYILKSARITLLCILLVFYIFIISVQPLNKISAQADECSEARLRGLQISIIDCSNGGLDQSCSANANNPVVSMVASTKIPEPHKAIIERAASTFSVNPNFVAALFLSEQGNVWKPVDSKWASSEAGASGPFQFMPGTWSAYKQDGNSDGVADIMNFEDAAFAAAKYVSTGTNQSTPIGDINKPFVPNTLIYFSAAYNWGGGNLQKKTTQNSPITAAPQETQRYMNNIYSLLSSDFTTSGNPNYGNPRMPGENSDTNQGETTNNTTGSTNSCISTGNSTQLSSKNATEARAAILSSPNIKWGNYGSAASQKSDVQNCLTETTLIAFATMAANSGVIIPVNALASDHGGCDSTQKSHHNHGRGIDLGYYGNGGQGQSRHKPEGDTLYKFLFDNRVILQIDELIWQDPPAGYNCIDRGNVGECSTLYSPAIMNQHYHHIHVSFAN